MVNQIAVRQGKPPIFNNDGTRCSETNHVLNAPQDDMGIGASNQNHIGDGVGEFNGDDSSEGINPESISESISNQNQVISGFPVETWTSVASPLIGSNSIIQGSQSEPRRSGISLENGCTGGWGELPLYDANLPFPIRNICLQVFFEPKSKETGKPKWSTKVEINNASETCKSDEWEYIFSGTLIPDHKAIDLFSGIVDKGFDKDDPTQADYIDNCIANINGHLGNWKLVSALAWHRDKGGRPPNSRPLHLWVFVDMGKFDCSRADVVQKNIWTGNALIVLGNQAYEVSVKWKPGRENARYISGRIIYQGYWFINSSTFSVDMGDDDLISPSDYDFS